MRNITKVISYLIEEVIPVKGNGILIEELKSISKCSSYTAPEYQQKDWEALANILFVYLGEPLDVEWKLHVSEILKGKIGLPLKYQN